MGSLERRIEDLERRCSKTTESGRSETFTALITILNELSYLKQSCAERWTGPKNSILVEGENVPRKVLGPGYTRRQLLELAVSRSVEAGRVPAERGQGYLEYLCEMSSKDLDVAVGEDVRP